MPSLARVRYVGRFAPSPTGPLHLGSLVAALASWLDARAHGGDWLVRIEDVDPPRCVPGADRHLLHQLAACGLVSDAPVVWQSQRSERYRAALGELAGHGTAYPCACSRKDIETMLSNLGVSQERHRSAVYPGTCRPRPDELRGMVTSDLSDEGSNSDPSKASAPNTRFDLSEKDLSSRAWRFQLPGDAIVHWSDRRLGHQTQDVAAEVGDFVVRRADGLWAYQLAVVIDDAAQGITHVVRGEDLADNTPRQILLQRALGLPTPLYLHAPLVLGSNSEKLSKQNGAVPLDLAHPLAELSRAAAVLGLPPTPGSSAGWRAPSTDQALAGWTAAWASKIGTAFRTD